MGYSWTTASGTVQDEIISEIHNNLDLLCSDLEIDEESWTTVTEGTEIDDTQIDDIKDAVIRADYWNYCRSHNASYDTSDEALHYSGHDGTQNSTQYDGHDSSHDSLYKIGAYDTHFNGRLYNHYTRHNESRESDHNAEKYAEYDSGRNITHRQSENSAVYKSKNSSKLFGDNISADTVDYSLRNSDKDVPFSLEDPWGHSYKFQDYHTYYHENYDVLTESNISYYESHKTTVLDVHNSDHESTDNYSDCPTQWVRCLADNLSDDTTYHRVHDSSYNILVNLSECQSQWIR